MALLDRYGSFWKERYQSGVPAAVVDAAGLYLRGQAAPGSSGGEVVAYAVASADRVEGVDDDGRLAWGYPVGDDFEPVVVTLNVATGPVWTTGIDFFVRDGRVWFYTDPLVTTAVAPKLTYLEDDETSAVLWAAAAAPLATEVRSQAGSYDALTAALAEAYDSPRFRLAGTVELVTTLADDLVAVTTDAESFVLPPGAQAAVAVGDAVRPGDPVGDAWRLVRLGPQAPTEDRVAVGLNALPPTLTAPLAWYNTPTATVVDTVSGKTRIRWALGGSGADVTAFWAAGHAEAVAGRVSMAHLLDLRAHPFGEPAASDLPTVVNPAEVLCRTLVGGAGYMVIATPAGYGPLALGTAERAALLRAAAGTSAGVFEFEGGVPDDAAVLP